MEAFKQHALEFEKLRGTRCTRTRRFVNFILRGGQPHNQNTQHTQNNQNHEIPVPMLEVPNYPPSK